MNIILTSMLFVFCFYLFIYLFIFVKKEWHPTCGMQIRNGGNDKSWIFEKRSGNDNLNFFQDLKNFLKQFKIV
jgi:hypothetical protein